MKFNIANVNPAEVSKFKDGNNKKLCKRDNVHQILDPGYSNCCPPKAQFITTSYTDKIQRSIFHNIVRPSFDIIALIIDIVGGNNDTNLLKKLVLVSHFFLQICSRHLFATVELHDADPMCHVASSKKGFIKLLESCQVNSQAHV